MKRVGMFLTFALLLVGCSREAVGNTGDLIVTGQVRNWLPSYGATLNAVAGTNEALGGGSIDAEGNFSATVSPPFYTLGNIEPCQDDSSTVVTSPESLRTSSVKLEIAEQQRSFVVRNDARSLTQGFTQEAINVYADQAGTIRGQVQCSGNTLRFNLTLVRGWNLIASNIQTGDRGGDPLIATYSSVNEVDVAAFNWYAFVP